MELQRPGAALEGAVPSNQPDGAVGDSEPLREPNRPARVYLENIRAINKDVYYPLFRGEKNLGNAGVVAMVKESSRQLHSVREYLQKSSVNNFLAHDLGSLVRKPAELLEAITGEEDERKFDDESLRLFFGLWPRYYVTIEDLLLRELSPGSVEAKDVGEFDVELLEKVIRYFKGEEGDKDSGEIGELRKFAYEADSQYKKIADKNFAVEADWGNLKAQLAGKKIVGNSSVIDNLLLNVSRNGLKDRIVASNVYFDAFVDGDELVLRVMNDGKGMEQKHLEATGGESVFEEGRSDTGSTGLGLTNAPSRVASVGGRLSVSSEREESLGVINKFTNIAGVPPLDLEKIREQRQKEGKGIVNTIWEIRLKLVDK